MKGLLVRKAKDALKQLAVEQAHRGVDRAKVDPRVTYPSYMDMDEFIDVDRLKSLNDEVVHRVSRRIRERDERFHTGDLTLKRDDDRTPGSQIIYLSQNMRREKARYLDLDKPELWTETADTAEFAS